MSATLTVNYKEIYSAETAERIEELTEENSYALEDILTFIEENSEADFMSYYEEYVEAGENIGYDVVDAFVKHHNMSYVDSVEEAFHGVYHDEATFAEDYEQIYGEVPTMLVIDWKATWESSLRYDYDFVDGYVFSSNF